MATKTKFDIKIFNKPIEEIEKRVAELLKENSISNGDNILPSGQIGHYLVDAAETILNPEGGVLISLGILHHLKDEVEAIGGLDTHCQGIPGGVMQLAYSKGKVLNSFYVRSQPKRHGKSVWIDGPLEYGSRICIVQDIVTDAELIVETIRRIKEEFGANTIQVIGVIDCLGGGGERLEELGIEYTALCTIEDVLGEDAKR